MPNAPRSRRERPSKPPLSREWIVEATIDLVRNEGLEKATMRRVAQILDTGPASLYVYIANTAELHAAVLDELVGSVASGDDGGSGDWADRLEALLGAYSRVLFTYPGLARSALLLRPMGPNTIGLLDRLLALMLEGGIPAAQAAWGADLLLQHVTASAAEHSTPTASDVDSSRQDEEEMTALARALRATDGSVAPNVAAHVDDLLSGTPEARQIWAIRALLAGIAATPIDVRVR